MRDAWAATLAQVVGADGITRSYAEDDHQRPLLTLFGEVRVARLAYRRKRAANLHPGRNRVALQRDNVDFASLRTYGRCGTNPWTPTASWASTTSSGGQGRREHAHSAACQRQLWRTAMTRRFLWRSALGRRGLSRSRTRLR
ncbi:MAG: hypothetical protein ACYCO3_02675 [Mycobacteriales bacterium]